MKKIYILAFALTLLFSPPCNAKEEITLKGQKIEITAPEGFTDVSDLSEEFRNFAQNFAPPTNLVIAYFIPTEEARKFLLPDYDVYEGFLVKRRFMVQAYKPTIQTPITKEEYAQVVKIMREQHASLIKSTMPKIKAQLDHSTNNMMRDLGLEETKAKLEISNVIPLNDFYESENYIQFGNIMKVQANLSDVSNDAMGGEVVVNEMAILPINGTVFYLYTYSTYESEDDVAWAQITSKTWGKDIQSKNQYIPPYAKSPAISRTTQKNVERVVERGVSGAATGFAIAIIIALFSGTFALLQRLFKKKKD